MVGTLSMLLVIPQLVSAAGNSEKKLTKFNLSSIQEINQYISTNKNVNVMLYDKNGKILNEFHSDSNIISYHYDANGEMVDSTDSFNGKEVYKKDPLTHQLKIEKYKNNKLVSDSSLSDSNGNASNIATTNQVSPLSTTVYEDYIVNNFSMNELISDSDFTNSTTMSQANIQTLFESSTFNSILKNDVTIYTMDNSGIPVYTGRTIKPSAAISAAATANGINPKVILVTLQKESSLVKDLSGNPAPSYSDKRFVFAMGYGKTDVGIDYSKSGFDVQIAGGTQTLKNRYNQSPSTGYPRLLPDTTVTPINYGEPAKSYGGVTYKNYVWVKNRATYSLYVYTPHTIDFHLPSLGGGNYLFVSTANGWWGSTNRWN
ncbi:hypothetical protein [Cohnella abietis]|uniref:Uncharacterized protein n=1 Tax=Cohnella abietis TaxID=2507935 RepID=A0A3T1D6W5_9BACL|nr:hypothetical protein [Cohnella abietis]BBI33813.1 hypothetical protein KCTCHS21_32120 [Cohnella abietis]